eukprot:6698947-Prorocentrum_lima.AAC.1
MTSSFVGSEMCIRDSPRAVPDVSPHSCRLRRRKARAKFGRIGHDNVPVSYTHLTLPTICSV